MPAKGSKAKKDNNQEEESTVQEFHSFDQVAAKLSSDFDLRFGKIEKVLEAISANVPALNTSESEPPAKKRCAPAPVEPHQTRSKGPAASDTQPIPSRSVKNLTKKPSATISKPAATARNAIDEEISKHPLLPEQQSAILVPPQSVNNNIPQWLTQEIQQMQPTAHSLPLSNRDVRGNDVLDDQVHQILATTTHHLTKATRNEKNFPCKYTLKGPERKPANVNTVSMQEHLWGISRMIRDPSVSQDIKPLLYVH